MCGGREHPSGESTVGTWSMRRPFNVAFTTISLANSIPVARRRSDRVPPAGILHARSIRRG
jgi:hypothetical protein